MKFLSGFVTLVSGHVFKRATREQTLTKRDGKSDRSASPRALSPLATFSARLEAVPFPKPRT